MNKKAQTEVLGLVIIIVLLILGVLFAIRFVVLQEPDTTKQVFEQSQLASNFGNALLKTTTTCNLHTVSDLYTDCGQYQALACPGGLNSCSFVNETLETILAETFGKWKRNYRFEAYVNPTEPLTHLSNDCPAGSPGEREQFFLPLNTGSILTIDIFICS